MDNIDSLNKFIYDFFSENKCAVEEIDRGIFKIQLTEAMDKKLMNRPFYWHYMKSTKQKGQPQEITLSTDYDQKDKTGDWFHLGSPLFKQIITHLEEDAKFTKLYEDTYLQKQAPLYPWLLLNVKIIYKSILSKEELFSLGLNLISGEMITNMMNRLENKSFHETISDFCYPLTPIITPRSGFNRIMKVFDQYIENQSHEWARYSLKRFHEEKHLINSYFNQSDSSLEKKRIIAETKERYLPRVLYRVVNGGIFYLKR